MVVVLPMMSRLHGFTTTSPYSHYFSSTVHCLDGVSCIQCSWCYMISSLVLPRLPLRKMLPGVSSLTILSTAILSMINIWKISTLNICFIIIQNKVATLVILWLGKNMHLYITPLQAPTTPCIIIFHRDIESTE